MHDGRDRLGRLDRGFGCLVWKPLTFAIGLVAALVFGAGALQVARRRGISEIDV